MGFYDDSGTRLLHRETVEIDELAPRIEPADRETAKARSCRHGAGRLAR